MSTHNYFLTFDKTIDTISRWFDNCARFLTIVILIIISLNAILNNFWKPFFGSYEYAQLCTLLVISLSLAYCGYNDGHAYVTFLTDYFPKKIERLILLINNIIAGGISWFIAVYTWKKALYAFQINDSINTIFIPKGPFMIIIAASFVLLGFVYFLHFFRLLLDCNEFEVYEGKVM